MLSESACGLDKRMGFSDFPKNFLIFWYNVFMFIIFWILNWYVLMFTKIEIRDVFAARPGNSKIQNSEYFDLNFFQSNPTQKCEI